MLEYQPVSSTIFAMVIESVSGERGAGTRKMVVDINNDGSYGWIKIVVGR